MGYVDLSYLNEISRGNNDFIIEMIKIFESQVQEFQNLMEKYLNEKDYVNFSKVAHKAKSSMNIMGLKELADQLKKIEEVDKCFENHYKFVQTYENFKNITRIAIEELNMIKKTKLI